MNDDAKASTGGGAWASRRVVVGVFTAALVIRVVHVAFMANTALVRHPTIDPAAYLARAQEITAGRVFPSDVFFQDPLYPYLLAAMSILTGGWALGPYVVHAVLGAVNCALIVLLGRKVTSARAAALAGFVAAGYGPFLYLDGMLEKNVFTIFFLLTSLWTFPAPSDRRVWPAPLSGFAMGCGALLRGNLLLTIPALAALVVWNRRKGGWAGALGSGALLGLAAVLPMAPFTIHNYVKSGDFILTTAQAGTAFYLGNNPENVSGGIHHISFNRQIPEFEADDWKREAERRAGKSLTRKEVSSVWFDAALRHITSDPGLAGWLALVAKKAELVVNRYEVPDNTSILYAEKYSPLVKWTPFRFAVVGPLGLFGLVLMIRRRPRPYEILTVLGIYTATLLLFPVSDRFRAPFAALMILTSGIALDAAWSAWTEKRNKDLVKGSIALLGFAALVNHTPWLQPPDTNLRIENARLKVAHDEAEAWIQAREWGKALAVLEEARQDPWMSSKAQLVLDLAVVKWNGFHDLTAARELVAKAVKGFLDSGQPVPPGYILYAELNEAQGKLDVAAYWRGRFEAATAMDLSSLTERARAAASSGEVPRATGIVEEVVFVDRRHPVPAVPSDAYTLLARLLLGRGDRARAADVVKALKSRGGAVPDDLTSLLAD